MMKKTFLTLTLLAAVAIGATARRELPVMKVASHASLNEANTPTVHRADVQKTVMPQSSDNLTAAFSVKGADTETAVWSEDFETMTSLPKDWTFDPTTHVTWRLKSPSSSYNDLTNTQGLFVEGDYRVYNREISSATSPEIAVPERANLRAFVYFSLNYDDMCRLIISASTDNFQAESVELWNSKDAGGEKKASWHPVVASLSDFAGKTIKLRFTYTWGSGDEIFKTGGYMGDFLIDGISVTAPGDVTELNVMTGETIDFVDCSTGDIVAWEWSFPGAVPSKSNEANPTVYYVVDGTYDVSLTVTDASGAVSTATKPGLVNVTGTAPVARIGLPASFRYWSTGNPMIAPLRPVTFTDASDGFPTEQSWVFMGIDTDKDAVTPLEGSEVSVGYSYLHDWPVGLSVSNRHGSSEAFSTVSVEYEGLISNFNSKADQATVFDMGDWGVFPGSNTRKITHYAEKFSKPSAPIKIYGAYVTFYHTQAEELMDQLAMIGVHLCKSENGLPGEKLDSFWWNAYELDGPVGDYLQGTPFPFTYTPVADDEFFIVVDGLPEFSETACVSIAMAQFRGEGNTTYMFKDNQWIDVSTYFPAGANHTSLLIQPLISHSVMGSATGAEPLLSYGKEGGTQEFELFSYWGYQWPVATGADWCRVTNEPGEMTVDTLVIECDPMPDGMTERETYVTPTDGASTYPILVRQSAQSGLSSTVTNDCDKFIVDGLSVTADEGETIALYTMQGIKVDEGSRVVAPSAGLYIVVAQGKAAKLRLNEK